MIQVTTASDETLRRDFGQRRRAKPVSEAPGSFDAPAHRAGSTSVLAAASPFGINGQNGDEKRVFTLN